MASRLRTVAGWTVRARIRMRGSRSIRSIWSSTAGRRETASGAYRASARNDSTSVSTELIHPVSARLSSQRRGAGDSGSARNAPVGGALAWRHDDGLAARWLTGCVSCGKSVRRYGLRVPASGAAEVPSPQSFDVVRDFLFLRQACHHHQVRCCHSPSPPGCRRYHRMRSWCPA